MKDSLSLFEKLLKRIGVTSVGSGESRKYLTLPDDFEEEHITTFRRVEPYTMTRPPRVYALMEAVKYVVRAGVPGAFAECGVWRGGSVMAMAMTMMRLGAKRDIHLYDTFEGMAPPRAEDVSVSGASAARKFKKLQTGASSSDWCRSSVDEVRRNVLETGYDSSNFHFHKGLVEETIPDEAPEQLSLLRLDTDFYESTKHELQYLYPRLSSGGVLLLDDYGYWRGARTAVDEYIREHGLAILLNRIDFAGRIAVKP